MTTAKPAFWLTRCPKCLAPLPKPIRAELALETDRNSGASCYECLEVSDDQARAEYQRRLAQGRVVARAPEHV